jgi:hypothetical protein
VRRLPPIPALLVLAALSAASLASAAAASQKKTGTFYALDSGGLVPVPTGYRAVSRPTPLDPESQTVALFRGDGAQATAEAEVPAAEAAAPAADLQAGSVLVQVFALSDKERADADFAKHLEEDLRVKAAAEPKGASVRELSDGAYRAVLYRGTAPALHRVYLFAPNHLVIVTSEFWEKAVAEVVKGYRDGP